MKDIQAVIEAIKKEDDPNNSPMEVFKVMLENLIASEIGSVKAIEDTNTYFEIDNKKMKERLKSNKRLTSALFFILSLQFVVIFGLLVVFYK